VLTEEERERGGELVEIKVTGEGGIVAVDGIPISASRDRLSSNDIF